MLSVGLVPLYSTFYSTLFSLLLFLLATAYGFVSTLSSTTLDIFFLEDYASNIKSSSISGTEFKLFYFFFAGF